MQMDGKLQLETLVHFNIGHTSHQKNTTNVVPNHYFHLKVPVALKLKENSVNKFVDCERLSTKSQWIPYNIN